MANATNQLPCIKKKREREREKGMKEGRKEKKDKKRKNILLNISQPPLPGPTLNKIT